MVTIKDIANECGVSPASVSRILNNDKKLQVTDETRKKVVETADKLGYVKRNRARSKSEFKLGILQWFSSQQELEDEYYLRIRKGVEDFCIKNSIQIVRAYRTDKDFKQTLKDCNGLVCVGKFSREEADELIAFNSRIVFLDMKSVHPEITTITVDLYGATKEALEFLYGLGHKKICYLGGIEYASGSEVVSDDRKLAYMIFMKKKELPYEDLIKEDEYTSASGYRMMNEVLEGKTIPTAVFDASDAIALGAIKAIKEHGQRIPEDISIIGFNDNEVSEFTEPPLTTMRAPSYDMGQHGANLVYVAGNLDIKTPLKVMIPCTMVKRGSCAECTKQGN